jgi:hypothetical protein
VKQKTVSPARPIRLITAKLHIGFYELGKTGVIYNSKIPLLNENIYSPK